MQAVSMYFSDLSEAFGRGWNRFWFTPGDAFPLSVIRVLTGLAALCYHWSFAADLTRWFGPHGLLTAETVHSLIGPAAFRWSPLFFTDAPQVLWVFHVVGLVILAAFTVGLLTRATNVLALGVVLSYVHRAPMIIGAFEPVLTMVLAYLCLAPSGAYLSVDRWLGNRRKQAGEPSPSVAANISLRLIQVHLAALYLLMGLTMLAGQPWWSGEALWLLAARTESRLLDLTFLNEHPFVINVWTHAVVAFALLFGVLIWNRLARPLLLVLAVVICVPLALVTGQLAFFAMLLIANLAFASPAWLRQHCPRCCGCAPDPTA
jgi:hypothetical protein